MTDSKKEVTLTTAKDVRLLGQIMASDPGEQARRVLRTTFMSRLSYTRGEADHTAFLEGQKSVIQFIENAVAAAKAEEKHG